DGGVFDGVAWPDDMGIGEAGGPGRDRGLGVGRGAGRAAVGADQRDVGAAVGRGGAVMAGRVGQPYDLLLELGTAARSDTRELARVHRRSMQVWADDVVHGVIGPRNVAMHIRQPRGGVGLVGRAKAREWFVAALGLERGPVDGATIEARRG